MCEVSNDTVGGSSVKEYIRREAKPKTKEKLIEGIKDFWKTVTVEKCTKYMSFT